MHMPDSWASTAATVVPRRGLRTELINQAIRLETPATATRQTRITSRHKVMLDTPAGAIHNTVDKAPENGITMTQQAGIEEGRQEIKGALFGIAGIPLYQSFPLFKLEQLIKAPDHAMGTKCRRPWNSNPASGDKGDASRSDGLPRGPDQVRHGCGHGASR